jgi:hypothetical protein
LCGDGYEIMFDNEIGIIDFDEINKALVNEFGEGVVHIRDGWDNYPYALRFEDNNVSQKTMDRATAIVDKFIPTFWDYENVRTE